jgi:peptidoglycan/LPS O-acetylase OafA/YrhL
MIGMAHNPAAYDGVAENAPLLRAASAALFLSQSWTPDYTLFSNESYWSLPYEFWYYVLFGIAVFLSREVRIVALSAAALIAGPKILLLLPIWLFGVQAQRMSARAITERTARLLFISSGAVATIIGVAYLDLIEGINVDYLPPVFSAYDYVFGIAIAVNLYAASFLEFSSLRQDRFLKYLAGMTFSLYLFHLPLLWLCSAYLPQQWSPYIRGPLMIAVVLVAVVVLSHFTEKQKSVLKKRLMRTIAGRARSEAAAR